jgi:hypothetical protein
MKKEQSSLHDKFGGTPRSTSLKKNINRLMKIIVGPKIKSIAQTVIIIYFNYVKFLR